MYLNKAFILGNLTRDPELKSLPSGMQVASFSLATNSVYKDRDGNKQEQTEYHNIVAFGRQGELCAQFLKKGASALVEGRIQTRSWDKDGEKRYRTEVVADRVQFGPRGGQDGGGSSTPQKQQDPGEGSAPQGSYPDEEINPEDIPF